MNNFKNTQNQWPIELIYRDPSAGFSYPPVLPLVDFDGVLYMPDFLAAVNSEIEWVSDEAPSIPYDVLHQIGLGLLECPICNGHQSYDLPKQGRTTGVVVAVRNECPCVRIRLYHRVMSKNVPARFRAVGLGSVEPSTLSRLPLDRQQVIIDHLQANPYKSYFLWGEAGTSKTHFMTALYSQAVWCATKRSTGCDFPVVRVTTATLLEQILAKVFDKEAPLPVVSPRAIKYMVEHGERPCLFLDEIDKFNPTQSRLDHLLEIVNCVYDSNGQVVATSNTDPQTLSAMWGKYHGDALLRRIGTEPDGFTIHFGVPGSN